MGWNFNWASSLDSDFHFDYGVSAGGSTTGDPVAPVLEANELGLLKLLTEQPAVREHLPQIATRNASASGTTLDGYFAEGHGVSTFAREGDSVYHCYSSYARGTEFLMGYYAILDRAPKGRDEADQPMHWLPRPDEYDERGSRGLAEPYRHALEVHCYRMLGSAQDAEDMAQETLLRAWRALERFEPRAQFQTWLYRIATNACLDEIERRPRRPQPVDPLPESPRDEAAAPTYDP